jgi:hypothetical protein
MGTFSIFHVLTLVAIVGVVVLIVRAVSKNKNGSIYDKMRK